MEHVVAILYHKIQDSDFTNMYAVKKPSTGGGQTYIQAAGYSREELDKMFKDAPTKTNTVEFWDAAKKYPRVKYEFPAITVGKASSQDIELAPRTGRKDYRIARQNPKYRHPAWDVSNGFPEPSKDTSGAYVYIKDYPGLIDNLYIYIIKTVNESGKINYYVTYSNFVSLPADWPQGVGLEDIFLKTKRQGIIFYEDQYIKFINDKTKPFVAGSAIDTELKSVALPEDLNESSTDPVEFAPKDIVVDIDYSKVKIEKVDAPTTVKRKKKVSKKTPVKGVDYERKHRNLKKIGDIGELLTIKIEKERLIAEGRSDLAKLVEQVSITIGDGLGYDVKSFEKSGSKYIEKYIEVKSTTGGKNKPFDITSTEVEASDELANQYYIYRFYGISGKGESFKYYEVKGSVSDHFSLEPTAYKAYCK